MLSPFQAIPQAQVTWRYRDTYINNGSTLLNDVDLRHYYHVEKDVAPGVRRKFDKTKIFEIL